MSGEGIDNPLDATELLEDIATLQDAVDDLDDDVVLVQEDVNAIREVTDSEAILTEVADTITTDGTEQIVYTEENPAGIFRPICFKIDMTNHTGTETVDIKVYYRIIAGGNRILQSNTTFAGAQDPDLINVDLEPNRYGIRITI
ncbi:MAG: hypothetical protein KAS32_17480, partial [Candidatus Peribacteraceae bacterium]|nr:hypothetical protein [Candidatus Peribacteraceae bacterium]